MAPNSQISMCVTSCNRHSLLKQTLESFYEVTDIEPQELIICEDSTTPQPEWTKTQEWRRRGLRWLSNESRMGQIYSCDRLMKEAKYPFVFWCEDDWDFQSTDFIRESKRILQTYPQIIQVSLRGHTGWHDLMDADDYPKEKFKIAVPYWRGTWGGLAFNPGLRRKSDYEKLGSYGKHVSYGTHGLGHEAQLSKKLLDQGYRIADLGREIVVHTGGTCSRAIEPLPPMPKLLIAIPACFAFEYGRWESEESPHYNAAKAWNGVPYGSDIHISKPVNDRIDAIRETWAKDVEVFKDFVTIKFFYGEPQGGFPRAPLSDEVFLSGVPDDYAGLPLKTVAICQWADREGFDWLYKGDDDTAVYVDRLIRELMENRHDYMGYCQAATCAGGPGYFLSKRALRLVATQGQNPDHWAEDVWVGKVLGMNRIEGFMLGGHRPGFAAHYFFPTGFDPATEPEDIVTMHALTPIDMKAWYAYKEGNK